jgi:hypothetical protein
MKHFPGSRIFTSVMCALALLCASALLPARSGAQVGGAQARAERWSVLMPVSHKNLTIFPVRGSVTRGATDGYITLDEGMKSGTVIITERGGGDSARANTTNARPRSSARGRRNRRNASNAVNQNVQQVEGGGDNASVNELALVNKSGKKLLLLAGEVIVGGKQDRIVQEDRIIPPTGQPVALDVFCVEQGRWSAAGGGRERGNVAAEDNVAAVAEVVVVEQQPAKFASLNAVAHPKLRAAAQDKKEQGAVWSEVRSNNTRLDTRNTTDTYQEVYANGQVGSQMDEYVRALEREVLQADVVGVVVARNGQVVWADIFASPDLFARYWPKLLKSYVVDALGDAPSDAANDKRATADDARRYLSERAGTVVTVTQEGVYQLVKTEHNSYAVFELRDIALAAPRELHFNKMDR